MNKLILSLLLLTLFSSCTSTKKVMDSWLGSTKQQLIMSWGPPARTASDGGTGEILVYANQGYYPGINGNGAFTYWDYKYMYADSDGKIYYWMTRRERVPPTQIDLNIYRRY
jgi:hypothetical protein